MIVFRKIFDHFKYNIPAFLKNIKLFLPVLWDFRTWDYNGILLFLQIAIKQIRQEIIETDRHIHSKNYFRKLDTAIHCLNRFVEDDYTGDFYSKGPTKGWCNCKGNDYSISIYTESKLNDNFLHHSISVPLDTKKSSCDDYSGPQWHMCSHNCKMINQLQQDDWDMFCDIFKKKLQRWWT